MKNLITHSLTLKHGDNKTLILLVASTKDTAGMNITQKLLDNYSFEELPEKFQGNPVYEKTFGDKQAKLVIVDTEIVDTQFLGDHFTPQLTIFLSRHSSVKGIPTLSVHTPGNLSDASFGGKPRKVSVSPAAAMRNALKEMAKQKEELKLKYEVSYECTHHGPSLDTPAMFVELGSQPKQWSDTEAAEAVAHSAIAALTGGPEHSAVMGVGGPHYNRKFTELALEGKFAFGHIIPKYAISEVTEETLRQCVRRTVEHVDCAVLDWKGIKGEHKSRIISALDKLGLSIEKV